MAAAAAAAGLPGRRYKKAPQTRRTSLDQPPPPSPPPPAALLSAPSAPPAAPSPGYPAAAWAGSRARPRTPRSGSAGPAEVGGRTLQPKARTDTPRAQSEVKFASPSSHSQRVPERPLTPHLSPHPRASQGRLPASGTCLKPPSWSAGPSVGPLPQLVFMGSNHSERYHFLVLTLRSADVCLKPPAPLAPGTESCLLP